MRVNSRTCSSLSASPMTIRAYMRLFLRVFRASGDEHIFELVVLFLREDLASHEIALIAIWTAIDDLFRDRPGDSYGDDVRFGSRIDIDGLLSVDCPHRCFWHFLHLSCKRSGAKESERNDSNEISA